MVRPYLPRFLREGDRAELKVVVNNAGEAALAGTLDFEILDPDTDEEPARRLRPDRRRHDRRALHASSPAAAPT